MGTSAKRGLMGRTKAKRVVPCAPAPASYSFERATGDETGTAQRYLGGVVERLARRTCNQEVSGSTPALAACWNYIVRGSPEFNSSAPWLVNSQRVCLYFQLGFLTCSVEFGLLVSHHLSGVPENKLGAPPL